MELYYAAFETFPDVWDFGTVHHTTFPDVTKDFIEGKAQRIADVTNTTVKVEWNWHNDDSSIQVFEPTDPEVIL